MINFTYLAIIFFFVEVIIFYLFKPIRKKSRYIVADALTFNSGLILLLYVFGKIFSIEYLINIDEYLFLIAIIIGALYLISITDEYYKNIKGRVVLLLKKIKNDKKYNRD